MLYSVAEIKNISAWTHGMSLDLSKAVGVNEFHGALEEQFADAGEIPPVFADDGSALSLMTR